MPVYLMIDYHSYWNTFIYSSEHDEGTSQHEKSKCLHSSKTFRRKAAQVCKTAGSAFQEGFYRTHSAFPDIKGKCVKKWRPLQKTIACLLVMQNIGLANKRLADCGGVSLGDGFSMLIVFMILGNAGVWNATGIGSYIKMPALFCCLRQLCVGMTLSRNYPIDMKDFRLIQYTKDKPNIVSKNIINRMISQMD